jgi:hypothetical protein
MAMVGHSTESIYRRYAIADEAMLKEGAVKLAAFHAAEKHGKAKVVPFQDRSTEKGSKTRWLGVCWSAKNKRCIPGNGQGVGLSLRLVFYMYVGHEPFRSETGPGPCPWHAAPPDQGLCCQLGGHRKMLL